MPSAGSDTTRISRHALDIVDRVTATDARRLPVADGDEMFGSEDDVAASKPMPTSS